MTLSTYILLDVTGTPASANYEIDSGVGSAPADRPSTFTPSTGYASLGPAVDYAVATAPVVRPLVFEAPSATVSIDPGLSVSG